MAARDPRAVACASPTTAPARTWSPAWPRRSWRRGTPSSGCSRSTRRRCRRSPGGSRRARSRSGTSSATSSTATASSSWWPQRWRELVSGLPPGAALVANGDDPQLGAIAADRPGSVVFGLDDPRHASPTLQHAADSKWCVRCGTPYEYAAAYIGHLGDYRCPACGHARPPLDVLAREIELDGLEGVSFELVTPEGSARVRAAAARPLQRLQRARGSRAVPLARRLARGDHRRLAGLFRRVRPLRAHPARGPLAAGAADQEPGRRERGRAHARRRRRRRSSLLVALNDAIADGRDVSWIWDVDFEPLLGGLERLIATGERAAELALRFKYAGLPEEAIEVVPSLEAALDRGLELTPPGDELTALPTYTAMLALRRAGRPARLRQAVLGGSGVRLVVGHLFPDYLNIYADRGNIAVLTRARRVARPRARGAAARRRRRRPGRASTTSSTSAAARTASRS